MPFRVAPFPTDLDDLAEDLADALPVLGPARFAPPEAVDLVGPFPAYSADPRAFLEIGLAAFQRSGWRAVTIEDDSPTALVDITFNPGGEKAYAYRSAEAAVAFADALQAATELDAAADFEVRWLSLPDIYVTALWLKAPDQDRFIPTRVGYGERSRSLILDLSALQALAAPLVVAARPPEGRSVGPERFEGEGRSGLPN